MRSLVHKKDNTKRNQILLGGFLILVMLFSTLGYALSGRGEGDKNKKIEYNGIEFIQDTSGYWYSQIQGYEFITKYNPEELEDISFLNTLSINDYSNKPLYFVGGAGEPVSEIDRNLRERFVLRTREACLNEEDCEGDLPIKNCSVDNMITINEALGNQTETIYQEEKCIFIIASYANQTRYADKFLFDILGL